MRATTRSLLWLLGATIVCTLTARPARADIWTASGTDGDGAISAQANFSISSGQIVVTITNELAASAVHAAGQAVSDLAFKMSNSTTTTNFTGDTATGQLVTVNKNNTVTDVSGTPTRWLNVGGGSSTISGKNILLETIGGGKPSQMILPSDNGGGYPNANASINKNFSPFVDGPATFTLKLAGVTSSTTITAVKFSFGTGPDAFLAGTQQVVPEPSTLVIAGLGALGFLGYGLRKRLIAVSAAPEPSTMTIVLS